MKTLQKCHCGDNATVYAGGPYAGDWAGAYCNQHIPDGFQIWDRFDNEGSTEMHDEPTSETINVATEEGRRRLAEMAADGPVFRVLHACDSRAEHQKDVT